MNHPHGPAPNMQPFPHQMQQQRPSQQPQMNSNLTPTGMSPQVSNDYSNKII